MKLGILLSGGKDSVLAATIAGKYHEIACAITIESQNPESYMFHVPNVNITTLQTQAMNIPHILKTTKGEKEIELKDLHAAIKQAKEEYGIQGVVTGAVASQYQASRIQTIANDLDIFVFNPLWQMNQIELLHTLLANNFKVIIAGIFAYPFDESWLGKTITGDTIEKLKVLQEKYQINPAGEGGEIETIVLDCPLFKQRIVVDNFTTEYENYAGSFTIRKSHLESKQQDDTFYIRKVKNTSQPDVTIISTVADPLHQFEFIRPITDLLEAQGKTFNIAPLHHPKLLGEKLIFTGTAIKDNEFLKHKEVARQIKSSLKPTLAICAGMELLLQQDLDEVKEVGSIFTESKEFPKYNYYLHQYGAKEVSDRWEVIATTNKGVAAVRHKTKPILAMQFHPEVSAKEVVKDFLNS